MFSDCPMYFFNTLAIFEEFAALTPLPPPQPSLQPKHRHMTWLNSMYRTQPHETQDLEEGNSEHDTLHAGQSDKRVATMRIHVRPPTMGNVVDHRPWRLPPESYGNICTEVILPTQLLNE